MKNIPYTIVACLLFLFSCSAPTTEETPKVESVESALTFYVDHKKMSLETAQSFENFEALFAGKEKIRCPNISIKNKEGELYAFNQNLGDVQIQKDSETEFSILEHYIIPIGNVYGKFALIRYVVDAKNGTIKRDQTFEPQLSIYKYWSNHIIKEYNGHLENPAFTNPNVAEVPHDAFDVMRFLMFNLTLAAILEDCEECAAKIGSIGQDFPFVESKEYYGQNLLVCKTILEKIKD